MARDVDSAQIGCWNIRAADTNDVLGWVRFDLRARGWRGYTVPTSRVHPIELDRRLFRRRAVALVVEWHTRSYLSRPDGSQGTTRPFICKQTHHYRFRHDRSVTKPVGFRPTRGA